MFIMESNTHLHNQRNAYSEEDMIQRALEESNRDYPNPDEMTYEQLLELGERLGKVEKGFTQEEIKQLP